MNKKTVIKKVKKYVKDSLERDPSGHDWWHVERVWKLSKKIAEKEGGDLFVIELAAFLHDIADWKFYHGSTKIGPKRVKELLRKFEVDPKVIERVSYIVANTSFKGAGVENKMKTIEGKIVQDADRLDALGAVGIARVFAYGGFRGREIHNPKKEPKLHKTFEEYKKSESTSINHFYEKILLLKDRLNTKTGQKIGKRRHKFVKSFLKKFFEEWEVKI